MFDLAFNDRLDHLPELGQLIQTRAPAIMELWEELIERHLPASKRTAYRCELRDHLPQFLQKVGRDLVAGRDGSNACGETCRSRTWAATLAARLGAGVGDS